MILKVLGSSSKGNCYLLTNGKESLIIEAGINIKEVKKALYFNLRSVQGCLITHEHGDHSKYAQKFLDSGINLYSSKGTFEALGLSHHRLKTVIKNKIYKIGGFDIVPFGVNHDCNDPLGYLIRHKDLGILLFATDTYYLNNQFPGVNHILIECNYSLPILESNVENELLHFKQKERVIKSHFGLDNVKEFLKVNDLSRTYNIVLLHLSDRNSNEEEFIKDISSLVNIQTYAAKEGLKIELLDGPF